MKSGSSVYHVMLLSQKGVVQNVALASFGGSDPIQGGCVELNSILFSIEHFVQIVLFNFLKLLHLSGF